jgi:hypothetical protein
MIQDHFPPGTSVDRQEWRAYLIDTFLGNPLGMAENMASKYSVTSVGGRGDDTTSNKRLRHERRVCYRSARSEIKEN